MVVLTIVEFNQKFFPQSNQDVRVWNRGTPKINTK
jgi:hypothetical protein